MFGPDPVSLVGVFFLTSLGTWGLPQMISKFYSIKSDKAITSGTIISTIFAVIVAGGCYFFGGFGRIFISTETFSGALSGRTDRIITEILKNPQFTDVIIGLVVILVLAASISTLAGLVMASASTLTMDFLKGHFVKNMKEKSELLVIRILVAVFIVISSVIAVFQYKFPDAVPFIPQLMGISWGALAGAFLAPFLYGLYWKKVTKIAVWVNFAFASCFMILNVIFTMTKTFPSFYPDVLKSSINAGAFVMLAGVIIVPLVSLFTKAPDKATVENSFSCYDENKETKKAV